MPASGVRAPRRGAVGAGIGELTDRTGRPPADRRSSRIPSGGPPVTAPRHPGRCARCRSELRRLVPHPGLGSGRGRPHRRWAGGRRQTSRTVAATGGPPVRRGSRRHAHRRRVGGRRPCRRGTSDLRPRRERPIPPASRHRRFHSVDGALERWREARAAGSRGVATREGARWAARGRAVVLRTPSHAFRVRPGDVVVIASGGADCLPAVLLAGAVVVNAGTALSPVAAFCRSANIPHVVGTEVATGRIRDGGRCTVRGDRGTVTNGDGDRGQDS